MGSRATPLHSFPTFLTGFLLLFAVPALGLLRYIDDSLGDLITGDLPTYRPEGNWKAGALCESCAVNPDPDTAFNGTWHESQSNSTESSREIEFTFNGTSIEVFIILSSNTDVNRSLTTTNLTFTLDGTFVWAFYHEASSFDPLTLYNISAFQREGLPHRPHTVLMKALGTSAAFFDYATYEAGNDPAPVRSSSVSKLSETSTSAPGHTTQESTSTPQVPLEQNSRNINIGAIVGGALGGTLVIALSAIIFFFWLRKRRTLAIQPQATEPILVFKDQKPDSGLSGFSSPISAAKVPSLATASIETPPPASPTRHRPPPLVLNRSGSPPPQATVTPISQEPLSPNGEYTLEVFQRPVGMHGPQPFRPTPPVVQMPAKITLTPPPDASDDGIMRAKQAEREQEFVRAREDALLSVHNTSRLQPPGLTASASRAVTEPKATTEEQLRGQVERLEAEMERMRAVQSGIVQEMSEVAPPPVYTENGHN